MWKIAVVGVFLVILSNITLTLSPLTKVSYISHQWNQAAVRNQAGSPCKGIGTLNDPKHTLALWCCNCLYLDFDSAYNNSYSWLLLLTLARTPTLAPNSISNYYFFTLFYIKVALPFCMAIMNWTFGFIETQKGPPTQERPPCM